MVVSLDRVAELAPDEVVREVRREAHVRHRVDDLQREQEVGREAVAMRLDLAHGDAGLVRPASASRGRNGRHSSTVNGRTFGCRLM